MADRPILVQAIHAYTPANNDELKLEKGEILTVARKEEGGWWEGTLSNGKTGWFPSNYVEDVALSTSLSATSLSPNTSAAKIITPLDSPQHGSNSDSVAFATQQAEYREVAFKELLDSETIHVQELQVFWEGFLAPLQKSDILNAGEFKILIGNFADVINLHLNAILNFLKTEQNKPAKDLRVGNVFLESAPKFEEIHKNYCANHPKAVQVVEKYKERLQSFIEGKGGRKPGILYIITSLSQPFRRLEKYPMLLQEIERHVEEFHKDRGDIQRSIEYYKEIEKNCCALRKQKEIELEVLSGAIKDWEGADVSQLGEIVFMNLVHLGYERHPRHFVLFPNTLLILSYNTETSCLVYEGKVPVSGITLRPLEKDSLTNAFEIAGPMIDQIIVNCSSKAIRETWLGHLNRILKTNRYPSFSSSPQQSFGQLTPPVQAWNVARLRPAPPFNPFLAEYLTSLKKLNRQEGTRTTSLNLSNSKNGSNRSGVPSTASVTSFGFGSGHSITPTITNEDDFAVLTLVDSFCTKNRHTVTSTTSIASTANNHNVSISSETNGKTITSSSSANSPLTPKLPQPPRQETLAQLVMLLREEVVGLKKSMEEEQNKRMALQLLVQQSLNNNNSSIVGGSFGNTGPLPSTSVTNLPDT